MADRAIQEAARYLPPTFTERRPYDIAKLVIEQYFKAAEMKQREDGVAEILAEHADFIEGRPALRALLLEFDLVPEHIRTVAAARKLAGLADLWKRGEEGLMSKPGAEDRAA